MLTVRHYPHAPIKEALIDFIVAQREDISLATLKHFGQKIKGEYPFESSRELVQAQFRVGELPLSSSRTTIGYLYHSTDRKQAVQARLNGFTFSRFEPYLDWDALRNEAKRLWGIYIDAIEPSEVQRIAVRYINQLNLPLRDGSVDFDEYLSTFLKFGQEAGSQSLEEFLIRLVLPQEDLNAKLVLTEALLPPSDPLTIGVILDIDLFRENTSVPVQSDDLWDTLEEFRHRKNRYFEGAVTDKARELFK